MLYTQENVLVSVFVHLAEHLREAGWNVFWHASGQTELRTGGTEQGTVTLVQAVPDNPTFINSNGSRSNPDQIVLPAFAMQVSPTKRIKLYELGSTRYEREMGVRIGGLASSGKQQRQLATFLIEWSDVGEPNRWFPIQDYSNPATPVELDPAEIWWAHTTTPEVTTEVDNVRYQINTELILRYVE